MTPIGAACGLGIGANLLTVVAVFLPWAQAAAGTVAVAGWGSGVTPRLLGMLVILCAALGIALLGTAGWMVVGPRRRATAAVAALVAAVALGCAVSVIANPGAFVQNDTGATVSVGAYEALVTCLAALAASVAAAALPPSREDAEAV